MYGNQLPYIPQAKECIQNSKLFIQGKKTDCWNDTRPLICSIKKVIIFECMLSNQKLKAAKKCTYSLVKKDK